MPAPLPFLGHGIGLRFPHYAELLERPSLDVDWFEAVTENFLGPGGRPLAVLERVRREVPIALHGVSLAVGSTDPLPVGYLRGVRALADRFEAVWISDHLCWGIYGGRYSHDLLPLPYTEEALEHVVARVEQVQELLGRRILLENVSSYVSFKASTMPEWVFLSEVAERADCYILLDINNIVVNGFNHGFAPETYIDAVPPDRVGQFHLANHTDRGDYKFDDHRGAVPDVVWALYRRAVERFGAVSSLVEWDEDVPTFDVLRAEARRAAEVAS